PFSSSNMTGAGSLRGTDPDDQTRQASSTGSISAAGQQNALIAGTPVIANPDPLSKRSGLSWVLSSSSRVATGASSASSPPGSTGRKTLGSGHGGKSGTCAAVVPSK